MTGAFRPSRIGDEPAITALMSRAFSAREDDPTFEHGIMHWKYWGPREDWSEPRSYVIERDGRIMAHAGLWPVSIPALGPGTRPGVHMIDWAWDPQVPAAGLEVVQELIDRFSFVLMIGGTQMALDVLPKLGFRKVADAVLLARPIRPFGHTLHHPTKDVRLPVRLARNVLWSRSPARPSHAGWQALPADTGEALSGAVLRERDERFFRYLARCPAAPCTLFKIVAERATEGYFALTTVEGQARIAGLWMNDPSPEQSRIGFELAQKAALLHTDAYEIVARRSSQGSAPAERAGMRPRGASPVLFYGKTVHAKAIPLEFQLADNDTLFMYGLGFAC